MRSLVTVSLFIVSLSGLHQGALSAASVTPTDAVLRLFDRADAVFLGERHWSRQDSDLRNSIVTHPDFPADVSVVVEFGNALYQDLLDRYLLGLEPVSDSELAQVWRNTRTLTGAWDSPIYEEFYRTVRRVNEDRNPGDRIRVIAAGLPVDWNRVEVWEDLLNFTNRGWWFTRQVERAQSKGKKVLVVGHTQPQ